MDHRTRFGTSIILLVALFSGLLLQPEKASADPAPPKPPSVAPPIDPFEAQDAVEQLPAGAILATLMDPEATIMSQNFEGTWPAASWQLLDSSSSDGGEFLWGRRNCQPRAGSYAGWSVGGGAQGSALSCSANYPNNAYTWAIYGPFNLSNATSATLSYHIRGTTEAGTNCPYDYLYVGSSTDGAQFSGSRTCGAWTSGLDGNGYYWRTLDLRSRIGQSQVWIAFAAWGVICVLLAGRRKMIGMPIVFAATYYLLGMWLKAANPRRLVQLATVGALVLGVALMLAREVDVSQEYADYATTLFTEGAQRSNEMIVGSSLVTLRQSGLLGSGLGTATQGRQHVRDDNRSGDAGQPRAWQEDGGSRLFRELGVPGILLVALAGLIFLGCFRAALRIMPLHHPLQALQIGITAVILANLASFAISHQQYSGDPGTGMMLCMFVGFVLSCPLAQELGWFDPHSGEGRGRRWRRRGSGGVVE